ncbi:DUF3616 domain-containing protein [Rufibacter glacialis]|uniref:DUF3616 domain-containing protein n=1 Tax=Rufibacter glacialis TaxID=1259555 RepID=A0A5M8QEH8_9BACT|nr:DUF3616 domain-containing protein [Rufibacter glacialis]KAA6433393.1 DUF3616 domain-containing protein [Rufibacter glacialis]GGK74613.1 hypothetical protein GCM10011405_23320 [Rufibacter glacialis]
MKSPSFTVELHFDPTHSITTTGKHVRDGLSTVLRTGDYLWLSCDEQTTLERLKKTGDHTFGEHVHFDLTEYLDLPDGKNSEIDIEGMGVSGGYLWLVGSHSLKRKKPRKEESVDKQIKRLAKVASEANRYLLARIPLVQDIATGEFTLSKECKSQEDPSKTLKAAQLIGAHEGNQLMHAIKKDPHLKDFLPIPGKDNGFDIEGLDMQEGRIFMGLRGPVLRGWAMVLELELEEAEEEGFLQLKTNGDGLLYKKHFLHLMGKGIRELRIKGDDLYVLAGPTMDLDGTIAVYRWPKAMINSRKGEQMVHRKELDHLFDVHHGSGPTSGRDKAEGLGIFDNEHLLVVFDSPTDDRKAEENIVTADVFSIKDE